jgi:hypothetical protein
MKNKLILALSVTTLALTFACSKGSKPAEVKNNNLSNLPSWVLDPNVADGVAAVGIASPSKGGIKFQIPVAELDAKANIAATIQSEISRVTKNSLRSANVNNSDDVEEFFAQASKEVVKNLPMSGAKRINIFQANDGTLYVHMVLKNEDYTKFLNDSEKSMSARLKKSALGRENINKSEEANKAIFDELEKERVSKSAADKS